MNPTLRNVLAVIAGIVLGSVVNMLLIGVSGKVIPLPEGIDPMDPESLKNNIHLFEFKHFIFPFLAHALGTLVGALIASLIGASSQIRLALIIGVFFLAGGIANTFMIPAQSLFIVVDLVLAYIPMAFIGYKISGR